MNPEQISQITKKMSFPDAKRWIEIYIRGLQLDRIAFLKELIQYDGRFSSEVEIVSVPVRIGVDGRIFCSPSLEKYIAENSLQPVLLLKSDAPLENPLKLKLLQMRRLIADAKQDTNDIALREFLSNMNVNNERALKETQ